MPKTTTGSLPRLLSYIVGICGALMLILGISIFALASSELSNQRITVAALDTNSDGVASGSNAGKPLKGPFTAVSQIKAITHHLQEASRTATGGTRDAATGAVTGGNPNITYGTAPSITLDAQGNCVNAVATWTNPAGMGTVQCEKGGQLQLTGSIAPSIASLRSTLTTGSFLISSLFVSVLAFGVATLIAGLGVLFMLVAAITLHLTRRHQNN